MHRLLAGLLLAMLCGGQALADGRQKSFDTTNYQPRGADNGMSAPPPASRRARGSRSRQATIYKVDWSWSSHSFASTTDRHKSGNRMHKGVFYYQLGNGRINTADICNNYERGSLIYRDCRKAAKRHFQEQCSSRFSAACSAAGMIP